jgi:hypothetical protein
MHEPTTAVYQVTRTGHDHCDVTEGILLDITPLKVDNQKVVTLYDKDLTLGINLLIGKSKGIITLPFTYEYKALPNRQPNRYIHLFTSKSKKNSSKYSTAQTNFI